ncbi:hypothetical protein BDQ12DRAFT_686876 [Crucibulum laeve]|uniref:NAD(P)-binding domain-containing protein n=1 Tax=Crucibulum laeve TaxID=68775 RepID=A0A5C3LTA0_9AGAR|nr:hypothetical protein BDQ12DRAFT_686876 [Crucibulum laeve]
MCDNVLVIGGSRNIGYYSAIRLLEAGSAVTFLLRSPLVFDNDEVIQKHVKSQKARLVKGDALTPEDVKLAWNEASRDKPVNVLLFTVGFTGKPSFHPIKGFTMDPPNLVTRSLLNVLCQMPQTSAYPKIIVLSTSGVSRTSRESVPFLLKPLYGYLIAQALKDKLGVERVIAHCAGWKWNTKDGEPKADIMGEGWKNREGLPPPGTLTSAVVLRPALLNDGECLADKVVSASTGHTAKAPYRVGEGEVGGWNVSRKDVAHFVVDAVTNHWSEYENKQISIAY